MLKIALAEEGIDPAECEINIDHNLGINIVNGVKLPIIYPKSWVHNAQTLWTDDKDYTFYFKGYPGKHQERKQLLEAFDEKNDSYIEFSNNGRNIETKDEFDWDYWAALAKSCYGLCPHQPDWPGSIHAMWTYRYIECLFARVIPVNFRATALSEKFTSPSINIWDDQIDDLHIIEQCKEQILDLNFKVACEKFLLSQTQCKYIISQSEEMAS